VDQAKNTGEANKQKAHKLPQLNGDDCLNTLQATVSVTCRLPKLLIPTELEQFRKLTRSGGISNGRITTRRKQRSPILTPL